MTAQKDIENALPQKQCARCGYPDCARYAAAVLEGESIGLCEPGGLAVARELARLTGRPFQAPADEEPEARVARIRPESCIGCTKCIAVCPVDAIAGSSKHLHAVIRTWCTGCAKCAAVCPTDCIEMLEDAPWTRERALEARRRYLAKAVRTEMRRLEREKMLKEQSEKKRDMLSDMLKGRWR